MAKILIAIPSYGDMAIEVTEELFRWAFHLGRRTDHEIFLGIKTKSEQFRARNALVQQAMSLRADYILFLDDDMVFNTDQEQKASDAYGWLDKLLDIMEDREIGSDDQVIGIVGGLYFQRQAHCAPVAMRRDEEGGYHFLRPDQLEGLPQEVDVVGGGCMLIDMDVFNTLVSPYFEPESSVGLGTDIQICQKAKQAGYGVWLHSGVELGHLRFERVTVTSKNRSQFMTDLMPGDIRKRLVATDIYAELFDDAKEFTKIKTMDKMAEFGSEFMAKKAEYAGTDLQWYREYAPQRVARQVWLNTNDTNKRAMIEFILSTVMMQDGPRVVLDFGCGIGVSAYTLAKAGHAVTACDLKGTGTFNFLRWRAMKKRVPIEFVETETDIPPLKADQMFDFIIAMDVLEHLKTWPFVLKHLADHLVPNGVLFCNNGVLDDRQHPEHYDLRPADFVKKCLELGLMPFSGIGYIKRVERVEVAS